MFRRRLLSIVGALGLVTGLLSSGVAAQADASMSDSTFQSTVSFYQFLASYASTFCYAPPATSTSCSAPIVQGSATSTSDNVAVCVEVDHSATPPAQNCSITQTTTTGNNIAIVIQIVSRNSNDSFQNATQDATIQQDNVSGGNFAAVVQFVKQSTGATGPQSQIDNQGARIEQNGATVGTVTPPTGHNLAILFESSKQSGSQGGAAQTQFSNEDVNTSPHHINQFSSGLSIALATQNQVQNLFGTGVQHQTIDPRCCSLQQSNTSDKFHIVQATSQQNNHQLTSTQKATSVAQCDTSGTNGCTTSSTTNQNGTTTTVTCGPSNICTAVLVCNGTATCPTQGFCNAVGGEGCPTFPPGLCFPGISCGDTPVVSTASFGNGALAIAPTSRSQTKSVARSAPSAALLT